MEAGTGRGVARRVAGVGGVGGVGAERGDVVVTVVGASGHAEGGEPERGHGEGHGEHGESAGAVVVWCVQHGAKVANRT